MLTIEQCLSVVARLGLLMSSNSLGEAVEILAASSLDQLCFVHRPFTRCTGDQTGMPRRYFARSQRTGRIGQLFELHRGLNIAFGLAHG